MRLPTRLALPVAVGGLLLLTGCSAAEVAPEKERIDATAPTADPATAPDEATAPDDGAEAPADEPTTAQQPGTAEGAACLEGTWQTDTDAMAALAAEVMAGTPGLAELTPEISYSGASFMTFDGSTVVSDFQEQVTDMLFTVDGQTVTTRTTQNGTMSAAYRADDTEITLVDVDLSAMDTETLSLVDGQEVEIPGVEDLKAEDMGGVSDYTCTATELRISPKVQASREADFVQVFTRR